MLPILLCEDVPEELRRIYEVISNYILMEELDMKIVCASTNPEELIAYIRSRRRQSLYFLDLNLNHEMNGFLLAQKIREYDPRGFIVVVTTHSEMSLLAFEYRIEALDYIIKDDPGGFEKKVLSCLTDAYALYSVPDTAVQKKATFQVSGKTITFNLADIYCIEAARSQRGIRIFERNACIDIVYRLSDVEKSVDGDFFRCHKSCIVNLAHVKSIDKETHALRLDNGHKCPVATRKHKELKKAYDKYIDSISGYRL